MILIHPRLANINTVLRQLAAHCLLIWLQKQEEERNQTQQR